MRLDRKIARESIVFFVLYIIAALPSVVLWAMVIYIDETLRGHGIGYWAALPVIISFIVNCLYIPLFYSKRKNELSENSGILIALVDILTLYLFLVGSVAIGSILSFLYYIVFFSDNVYYFYFIFGLYYSYFVFFLFRYRFRQYKLLF